MVLTCPKCEARLQLDEAKTPRTRKVKMRSAVVMTPDAGTPFSIFLGLVRFGLGGKAGDGRQFVSWVHHDDFVRRISAERCNHGG